MLNHSGSQMSLQRSQGRSLSIERTVTRSEERYVLRGDDALRHSGGSSRGSLPRAPIREQMNSRMRDISHTSVTSTVLTGCSTLTSGLTLDGPALRRSACSVESESGRNSGSQPPAVRRRANSECSLRRRGSDLRGKKELTRSSAIKAPDAPLLEAITGTDCFTPGTHQRSKSAAGSDFQRESPNTHFGLMSMNQISDIGVCPEDVPFGRARSPTELDFAPFVESIGPNMSASVVGSRAMSPQGCDTAASGGALDWMEIVSHIISNLRNANPPLISGLERSAFLKHLHERNLWHLWGAQLTKGSSLEEQALSVKDFCEFEMWQLTQETRASVDAFARASMSVPPAPPPLVDSNQWPHGIRSSNGSFQRMMSPASTLPYDHQSRIASPPPPSSTSWSNSNQWSNSDHCGGKSTHQNVHPRSSWSTMASGCWHSAQHNQHLPSRSPTPVDSPPMNSNFPYNRGKVSFLN
jgi:hypothetical protein